MKNHTYFRDCMLTIIALVLLEPGFPTWQYVGSGIFIGILSWWVNKG